MKMFVKQYLWRVLVLAAALLCWHRALVLSLDMVKSEGNVSFRYISEGVPSRTIERILEEETAPFAAWRQKNGGTVEEKEFSRNAPVQVLEVAGDTELVLRPEEMRYGFLPGRGDTDSCAIDEATAYTLWGGADATGETLIYENREYIVAGIFTRLENTLLLQSGIEAHTVFPYLELLLSGSGTARSQSDEFITRYALTQPDILTDNVETAAIMRQFALFPALAASALLLWRAMRLTIGKPASFLQKTGCVAVIVAGIFITALAVGFSPVLPVGLIPARWANFSFWPELIGNISERVRLNRAFSWPAPDLLSWQNQRYLLLYSGGALIGLVVGVCKKI